MEQLHNSGLPSHFNYYGNKEFTNYQRISLIVLYKRSKKKLRIFIKELHESKWPSWLQLKKIPGKSTLHDWLRLFGNTLIRHLVELVTDIEKLKIAAIDGTGLRSTFRSSYYEKRLKDFKLNYKSPYHKLDIIVDTQNKKQILDYSFLTKNRSDTYVGKKLVKRSRLRRCKMLADKGYPDYSYETMSKKCQINFISPPKDYGTKCRSNRGKRRRKKMNFESNKGVYKRRVIVEGVISVLKRAYDMELTSRLPFMKKREVSWNILLYNIDRNIIFEENTIGPKDQKLQYFFITISIFY